MDNFLEDFDNKFPTFFGDMLPEGVFAEGGFSTLEDLLPRGVGAASSIFFDLVTPSGPWGGDEGGEAVDEVSPGDPPGERPAGGEKVEEPESHRSEKSSAQKRMIGDEGKQERDIPHPKSSRSSAWLNSPISVPGRHYRCSAFRRRHSTVSIIVIVHSARLASKIAKANLARSGTASQMISVPILLIWLWIRPI